MTKYTAKRCALIKAAAAPPAPLRDGAVATHSRSKAEVAEVEAFKKRFAGYEPLARVKATKSDNTISISFDHPDKVLAGTRMANTFASIDPWLNDGLLLQISSLASSRAGDLDTKAMDFMLATVKGIGPQDPIETLLAVQMAAVHNATMTAAKLLKTAEYVETRDHALTALNKCARTFVMQVEALKKHRSTGEQIVRVQHVTVNDGGQAIVTGQLEAGGGGGNKRDVQPHELETHRPSPPDASGSALLGHVEAIGQTVPSPGAEGAQSVPVSRGPRRSAKGCAQRPVQNRGAHH